MSEDREFRHDPAESTRDPAVTDLIVGEYLDRLNAGQTIDPLEVVADHPENAQEVLDHLESFVELQSLTSPEPLGTVGDYTLRRQIGRGGMGVVYEAWQGSMDRVVALKVLPPGIAADNKAFHRFMREAKTAGQLSHQNIVGVHSTGVEEGTPWYSMELVEGETLAQVLARIKDAELETDTPFGKKDDVAYFGNLARAFADVADGLQHAHSKGVVHRDIKPSNLIFDGDGKLRILDFGLAYLEGQESLTLSGDLMGTVLYMSPEQAMAKRIPLDHRTDVYSLGATMFETLTGQPPFRGKDQHDTLSRIIVRDPPPPRQLSSRVPKDFETIVLKCLRKDSGDRYGTAEALGQDLRRFVRGDAIEARQQSNWGRLARRFRRHRTSAVVATAFLVITLGAAWLGYSGRLADQARRALEYDRGIRQAVVRLTSGQFSVRRESSETSRSIDLPPGLNLLPLLGDAGTQSIREASEDLRLLAKSLPERKDAHYHLARSYRFLGDNEAAIAELRRTLEIDPDFVPARELAREIDETAADPGLTKPPADFAETGWQRKWLEANQARKMWLWGDAAQAYTELLEERPEPYIGMTIEARLGRSVARLELGWYEKAQEDLAVLRDDVEGCVEAVLLLGKAYLGVGTAQARRRAEELFQELFDSTDSPAREETALWIALVYASRQEFEPALAWSEPLDATAAKERLTSYLYRQLRQFEKSTRAAKRAVETDPDTLESHIQLGLSLLNELHVGRRRDADVVLELAETSLRAVELERRNWRARSLLRTAWDALILQPEETSRRDEIDDMRTRMSEAALAVGIVLGTAGIGAAQDFLDDFEDGDIFDGSPVSWGPEASWSRGIYDTSSGDLVIGSNGALDVTFPAQAFYSETVSVRTRLSIQRGATPGVFFGTVVGGAYLAQIRTEASSMSFNIRRWDGTTPLTVLRETPLPADFEAEEDHFLQLDVRGELVEMRVWRPGAPMPEAPVLSVADTTYRSGNVGIHVRLGDKGPPPQTALATYRFLQASSAMLPDPADPDTGFLRGDCNSDSSVDISDAIFILQSLFLAEEDRTCEDACDSNDDGDVDISDAVATLGVLFLEQRGLPLPGVDDCGIDPTEDELGCQTFERCP